MAIHPRRKSDAARRANQIVRSRTVLVMLLLGIVTFAALFWRLYDLQIRQHAELQEKAISQQTRSAVVSASRGTIYDRTLNTLAISATAETVLISPLDIEKSVESQKEEQAKAAQKAADKGQDYTPPVLRDQSYIARGLSRILGLEQGAIEERMEKTNSQYEILKKKTDQTISDEVRRFINGEIDPEGNEVSEKQRVKLRGIWLQPDSKRYYLYSSLASGVIGFVNGDGIGSVGLEAKYDDTLTGTAGYTVSARNASGSELLYANVQLSLENGLENMLKKYDAKNGGTGIVMDVNTGAIIAMASYPNYDLNDYSTIFDAALQKKLDADLEKIDANRSTYESEKAYADARAKAINSAMQSQWRNKCIDSTYEPGSTFKPITLAAALEEGKVSKSSTFYCGGYTTVPGWSDRIWCSNHSGHGQQTLIEAVGHSCNPAFIKMGLSIGTETYYKYLKSFGLMDKTGIDMIGEVKGLFVDEDYFNSQVVSLASYSFGQTFNVTPIELIRAQAACINGGYLYEPYIVDQVLDEDDNVLSQHDTTPVRQVISEETSAIVREALEYVVSSGSGKNGQVAGYRIGGKTGTADKTGTRKTTREVVVSFMCFAPADDPQYIMLLTMDTPSRNTGTAVYGGTMVAPTASQIMGEILPALGIEPDYSAEELSGADAAVPYVVGKTAEEAKAALKSAGFTYRTVGSGETVTDQTPAGGAIVPNNASVVLYLGAEKSDTPSTVPDVTGKTPTEANKALTNAGLIMKVAGATSASGGSVTAISQNAEAGSQLPAGSVVTVRFGVRTTD